MSRHLFPRNRMLLGISRQAGRPAVSLAGTWRTMYADRLHTTLADITTLAGDAIPNSRVQVDDLSQLPEFYGPDNVTQLFDDQGGTYNAVDVGDDPGAGGLQLQTFDIAIANDVWEFDHALGRIPTGIQALDQSGQARFGFLVELLTQVHIRIRFGRPIIGRLVIS